jgi:hypothetical protein
VSGEDYRKLFDTAASQWLCDPYSIEIRFIASKADKADGANQLLSCVVNFWPIAIESQNYRVSTDHIVAGRQVINDHNLADVHKFLSTLESGQLVIDEESYNFSANSPSYYTEMISTDRWLCDAHLLILGDQFQPLSNVTLSIINSQLRCGQFPFDGVQDLLAYLNLTDTLTTFKQSQIDIRISPPVDIRIDESFLSNSKARVVLHAHPNFDTSNIFLAIREIPESPQGRKQLAHKIKWRKKKDRQIGTLLVPSKKAIAVQAILMAGPNMVRRQFFEDLSKVPNRRFFAVSLFDKEFKRLKNALNENNQDSFEKAVNTLAYLSGLAGCVMNETDAPDIILSSPNENLVLIECTTRIADFSNKLGKLVDRKNALINMLQKSGDSRRVYGYLVCSLPKAQIAFNEVELARHKITLLTKESLELLLDRAKFPQDIEAILEEDEKVFEETLIKKSLQ